MYLRGCLHISFISNLTANHSISNLLTHAAKKTKKKLKTFVGFPSTDGGAVSLASKEKKHHTSPSVNVDICNSSSCLLFLKRQQGEEVLKFLGCTNYSSKLGHILAGGINSWHGRSLQPGLHPPVGETSVLECWEVSPRLIKWKEN